MTINYELNNSKWPTCSLWKIKDTYPIFFWDPLQSRLGCWVYILLILEKKWNQTMFSCSSVTLLTPLLNYNMHPHTKVGVHACCPSLSTGCWKNTSLLQIGHIQNHFFKWVSNPQHKDFILKMSRHNSGESWYHMFLFSRWERGLCNCGWRPWQTHGKG